MIYIDMVTLDYMDVVHLDILSPFENTGSGESQRSIYDRGKHSEIIYPKQTYMSHDVHTFKKTLNGTQYHGHHTVVYNPRSMLSVLEPLKPEGCSYRLTSTVPESAKQKKCFVAVNGGFFNHLTSECYGNVISDGKIANTFNGKKSSGFAITKDGGVAVGYFLKSDLYKKKLLHLISGIGWILRNGESYVEDTFKYEQCNLNNVHDFVHLKSSRTFIGHDVQGYVHIVQVDGKTRESGITLTEAPALLKSFGLINVVNLNGGGTSTFVVNNTIVNYPSNVCEVGGHQVLCPMNVSTILCVHMPERCENSQHCHENGRCEQGTCICQKNWSGRHCENYSVINDDYCCWLTYSWIIVLSCFVGVSVVFNVFICNLYLMYRARYTSLIQPKVTTGDELRKYLKDNKYLSSSNDESAGEVT